MVLIDEYQNRLMQQEQFDELYGQGHTDGFLEGRIYERKKVLDEIAKMVAGIQKDYTDFAEEYKLQFAIAAADACGYILDRVINFDNDI